MSLTIEEILNWRDEYLGYTGSEHNLMIIPNGHIDWLIQKVKDQQEKVKDLEEGIKHQRWMLYGNNFDMCSWIHPADKELYKLIEEGGE
jgi:hypothetical protein